MLARSLVLPMETPLKVPTALISDKTIVRYNFEGVDKLAVALPLCNGDRLNVSVPVNEITS